jgi:hypothetical protein
MMIPTVAPSWRGSDDELYVDSEGWPVGAQFVAIGRYGYMRLGFRAEKGRVRWVADSRFDPRVDVAPVEVSPYLRAIFQAS